ncbi:MAG TPA: DUF1761 domain-containing protein [Stellaceae bacterium]|nr:DUF1761 domain-containing protein [Stellaceae bacterium]
MAFAGVNYLAVLLGTVAAFVFGGAWYGVLGKRWLAALGKEEAAVRSGPPMALRLAIAVLALLVMAYMLAGVIGHLGPGQVTLRNGLIGGFFIWIGFVLTTLIVNYVFQNQKPMLTVIDGGHWLGVLLIEGAIIGAIGV